jgi:hypothetical protein
MHQTGSGWNRLVKPISKIRYRLIIPLIIGSILLIIFLVSVWPSAVETFYQKPPNKVSVIPESVNLTLTNNETVSKRIRILFDEPVQLVKVQTYIPPNLTQYLDPLYDDTIKTDEHFVYIVINGSEYNVPVGDYQGVIRLYYGIGQEDSTNLTIPLNMVVIKKAGDKYR